MLECGPTRASPLPRILLVFLSLVVLTVFEIMRFLTLTQLGDGRGERWHDEAAVGRLERRVQTSAGWQLPTGSVRMAVDDCEWLWMGVDDCRCRSHTSLYTGGVMLDALAVWAF